MVLRLSGRRIWRCVPFAIGLLLPLAAIAWLMPGPTAIEHLGPEAREQRYKQQIRSLELALEQRDTALTRERKLSRRLQQELQDASRQIVELSVFRNVRTARATAATDGARAPSAAGSRIVTGAIQVLSSRNVRVPPLAESNISPYAPRRARRTAKSPDGRSKAWRAHVRRTATNRRNISRSAATAATRSGDVLVRALDTTPGATPAARHVRVAAAANQRPGNVALTSVTGATPTPRRTSRPRRARSARYTRPSRLGRVRSKRRRTTQRARRPRPRNFFNRLARRGVFGPGYVQ